MDNNSLSLLMDLAVREAKLASRPRRFGIRRKKAARWTKEEIARFRALIQDHSLAEIARVLGRTEIALLVMRKRFDIPAPSRQPGWLTGYQAGLVLGLDIHSIMILQKRGLLPLEWTPGRSIRRIRKVRLWSWSINPMHWPYFRAHQVRDPHLRRLVELAQSRWGDQWLPIGEMTRRLGRSPVLNQSRHVEWMLRHNLAVRWGNWWIRESAESVLRERIRPRGMQAQIQWSARADAFIARAWNDREWTTVGIAARMKIGHKTLLHHIWHLQKLGVIEKRAPRGRPPKKRREGAA